jgi:hypothetical protein
MSSLLGSQEPLLRTQGGPGKGFRARFFSFWIQAEVPRRGSGPVLARFELSERFLASFC